jgi:hypothetical protein
MVKKLQVYEAPSITVSLDANVCRHTGVGVCLSGALQFYRNSADDHGAAARLAQRARVHQFVQYMAGSPSFWTDRS